jgi:hypothetical protein
MLIQARQIPESEARRKLVQVYLLSVGAVPHRDLAKIFRWSKKELDTAVHQLANSGVVHPQLQVEDQPDKWVALAELV